MTKFHRASVKQMLKGKDFTKQFETLKQTKQTLKQNINKEKSLYTKIHEIYPERQNLYNELLLEKIKEKSYMGLPRFENDTFEDEIHEIMRRDCTIKSCLNNIERLVDNRI